MTTPPDGRRTGPYVEFQHVEEPKLEITVNNKQYEIIKVRRRIGGSKADWQELDLDKLSPAEKKALVDAAKKSCKVFDRLDNSAPTADLKNAHTLTLQFFQEYEERPGLLNQTLGKHFERFAWKPELNTLKQVRYKASEGSKEKTYDLHLERYSPEEQAKIHKLTKPLTEHLSKLADAQHKNPYTRTLKKKGPTTTLQSAVKEAGSNDNKCMALSVALIQNPSGTRDQIIQQADRLISNSARELTTNAGFTTPGNPKYYALLGAVLEYNASASCTAPIQTDDPVQMCAAYARLINQTPGQMLDRPFFLTLDKPTIVLEKDGNGYKIKEIITRGSSIPPLNSRSTLADFNAYYIVLYEDAIHYKAVIPEQQHVTALQAIVRSYEVQLLNQLERELDKIRRGMKQSEVYDVCEAISNAVILVPTLRTQIEQKLIERNILTSSELQDFQNHFEAGGALLYTAQLERSIQHKFMPASA